MNAHFTLKMAFLAFAALVFTCLFPHFSQAQPVEAAVPDSSAVILAYHRIGEDSYPEMNLSPDRFISHIDEIESGDYNVMALPAILDALEDNKTLPANTIAITFEGGYKSAFRHAMPELLKRNIPFTVFFSSGRADENSGQYMNWQDIQTLEKTGLVNFGLLPATYARFARAPRETILTQINKARVRFREKLDREPEIFSYPFGEYSATYKDIIAQQGFKAAFGLQSGALYPGADTMALPRFSMTEGFGSLDRFKLVVHALPFMANNIIPSDPQIRSNMPAIGFSVTPELESELKNLSCFLSGEGKIRTEIIGSNRVELRLDEPLDQERTRVNCTIPVKDGGETGWRWFGMLLVAQDYNLNPPQDELQ